MGVVGGVQRVGGFAFSGERVGGYLFFQPRRKKILTFLLFKGTLGLRMCRNAQKSPKTSYWGRFEVFGAT
jgi:hypothetical protein